MNIIHTLKNSIRQEETILILTLTSCGRICRQLRLQACLQVSIFFMDIIFVSAKMCAVHANNL